MTSVLETLPPQVSERRIGGRVDLLDLHRAHPERYPFLLESVAKGAGGGASAQAARYDLLFAFPQARLWLHADGRLEGDAPCAGGFLEGLDAWWRRERVEAGGGRTPFRGGWFVFLGYELAAEIEPVLERPAQAGGFPVAAAERVPAAIVRDRLRDETWLVAEPGHEALLEAMEADCQRAPTAPARSRRAILEARPEEEPPDAYLDAVERIKRYIRAGDVFQVNLSRAWRARLGAGVTDAELYARLRRANPAPFAGLAALGEHAIVSSSPERLVSVRGGVVETRPIAGTHPRNRDAAADRLLAERLLAHPKERAEHIMLIDLERNDLGRVCRIGSVTVSELMALESYAHVHHIVSNVRGVLAPGLTPVDVIRAVFPGGTITGCPKVRCMQIIGELERGPRGPYTGAMGYINRDGDADFNILIRTLVRAGRTLSLRTGAGIVADSAPARELGETRHKARGVLRALA